MTAYPNLFSPLRLGGVELSNRIVCLPHLTGFAENDQPSERHARYYAERARGGAGLIISEAIYVHPSSKPIAHCIIGNDPKVVPGLSRIAAAVHEEGARVFAQLLHAGRQMTSFFSGQAIWAPSPIPCPVNREVPHEMTADDIAEVVTAFRQSARHVADAGYDGVEISAAHGYLLQQFLSPWSNRREDEYGGSLENRVRLTREVIEAVRSEIGREVVLGVRISADELMPGEGLTLADMCQVAEMLEATGALDYMSVSVANYTRWGVLLGDISVPPGGYVPLAAEVRKHVSLPVIAAIRINRPELAERVLAEGSADLVGLAKGLIADPEWPRKAREGRADEIRPCVACLQECRKTGRGARIGCTVNPAAGNEVEPEFGPLTRAERSKQVLVIGGGPAGLEAARVAAERGHRVTLVERSEQCGGQVLLAAALPGRSEIGEIVRWLVHEVERLGVQVKLGTEATPALVQASGAEAVVVATGSVPTESALAGNGSPTVCTAADVLLGRASVGERVVVVDAADGGLQCYGTAELLASQGKRVEVITPGVMIGAGVPPQSLPMLLERLVSSGVTLTPLTRAVSVGDHSLIGVNPLSGDERVLEPVDTVVVAGDSRAENWLARELDGVVPEIHVVGDCVAPRHLTAAIRDGYLAGLAI